MSGASKRAKSSVLTTRALNRAFLARQMLLERSETLGVEEAVRRLVALQAQVARPPFVALWSRLERFSRDGILDAARGRRLVRATMMRGTIHLMLAEDYRAFRGPLQPAFDRGMRSVLKGLYDSGDLGAIEAAGREFFARAPATFEAFRRHVKALRPDDDARAPAYVVRMRLPLVQVPTDAAWGWPASADFALADEWLGDAVSNAPAPADALVRRYLAAFGPATIADAQCWTGLGGLRATFDAMRDELLTFRDERGRELFDLPDAPRPGEEVEAPVRFLPEFDNAILGHDDRDRIVNPDHRSRLMTKNLLVPATFLVDGMVAGCWSVERTRKAATLRLGWFGKVARRSLPALRAEGERLLDFLEPEATDRSVVVA